MHEIFHDLERAEAECLASQWLDRRFPASDAVAAGDQPATSIGLP